MLDPWIIEQIRRREEERRRREERPSLEMPLERPPEPVDTGHKKRDDQAPERCVIIIQYAESTEVGTTKPSLWL